MTSTKPPQERFDQKFNLQFGLQIIIMIIFLQARSSEGVSPKEASRLSKWIAVYVQNNIVFHFRLQRSYDSFIAAVNRRLYTTLHMYMIVQF